MRKERGKRTIQMNHEQIKEDAAATTTKPAKKVSKKSPANKQANKTKRAKRASGKARPAPKSTAKRANKKAEIIDLMRRPGGGYAGRDRGSYRLAEAHGTGLC
jgi:hypothetical protein